MIHRFQRLISGILAALLLLTLIPAGSLASQEGLCPHHESHGDCGFSAGAAGSACTHIHDEQCYLQQTDCIHSHGDCGYVSGESAEACLHTHDEHCGYAEGSAGVSCLHECGEFCLEGCTHTHDEVCGYQESVPDQPCTHVHDAQCGYREGRDAVPCDHACSEDSGCVTGVLSCVHSHDAACGYAEETAASECSFVCEVCGSDALSAEANADLAADPEETVTAIPATESVPEQTESEKIPPEPVATVVNPLFANVVTEEDLLEHTPPQISFFSEYRFHTTPAQAAAELKEYMKERVNNVRIGYVIPIEMYTNAGFSETVESILKIVYTHTGVPDEGDYLFGSYPGWSGRAPFVDYCSCGEHYKCYFDLTFTYLTTTEQEDIMDQRVASLLRNLNPTGSDYRKIKTVYDWVCKNIEFDYDNLEDETYRLKHSAYAALVNGSAVCSGFGTLMYRLALEMGVDCRYIVGNEGAHAWNIVRIGTLYYNLDASWDTGNTSYKYFLRNDKNFSGHVRNSEYRTQSFYSSYPMGQYDYDPSAEIVITKQPASVWVYEGSKAAVSVQASGDGITYKWYISGSGSSKFTPSDSFSGNIYSVTMDETRNGRRVYCRITDKYGNYVITDTATLYMRQPLKITQQPVSGKAFEGDVAKATVKAQGDGLTYQWYYANVGETSFSPSSHVSGTYSVKMSQTSDGRRIYCVITDRYGDSVRSDTVTLSMKNPAKITVQPTSARADAGKKAVVSIQAQGDGLKYAWYYKDTGMSGFVLTNTFKGDTYSVTMSDNRNGRQLYCVVSDRYGNSVKSNTVTVTLKQQLKILQNPVSVRVAEGTNATVSVKAQGDDLKYTWYFKNESSPKFAVTTSFKGSTYSVKMNESRNGRKVYCVISDAYGNSVTTNTVTISMRTALKITAQPQSASAGAGETVTATVRAQGDGLTYKWYFANAGASKFILTETFKGNTYQIRMDAVRSGRRVYCVITDQYGNSVKSNVATLVMSSY